MRSQRYRAPRFGNKPLPVGSKEVKQLSRTLEKSIGPREEWRLPLLRELWSELYAGASRRRRSADHERVFLQLTGYSLRLKFLNSQLKIRNVK